LLVLLREADASTPGKKTLGLYRMRLSDARKPSVLTENIIAFE